MGCRHAAEHRGVGIEAVLEIIDRALLQAFEHQAQVLVRGARAELVPARADAAFQHGRDTAEMVGDDLQVGVFVHDAGEHQPRHRRRGLVGPAQGPPDFVFRFFLAEIIGEIGGARRMQPDRLAELVHGGEERVELGIVERLAGDVGVDLHAERAVLDRALALAHAGVGRGERGFRHPAGEIIGIFLADLGEAVVDQLGVFLDLRALGERRQRRHRIGQDLRIVVELIDNLPARVEIVDAGDLAHPLADIGGAACHDLCEKSRRDEVGIGVDAHEVFSVPEVSRVQADWFSRA